MKKNGIKLTYKNFWIFENKIKKKYKNFLFVSYTKIGTLFRATFFKQK